MKLAKLEFPKMDKTYYTDRKTAIQFVKMYDDVNMEVKKQMIWKIKEKQHANHTIKVNYYTATDTIEAIMKGPRAGSTNKKTYTSNVEKKLQNKIPFMTPTAKQIREEAWNAYKKAEKRIDTAIAEHAKKYGSEYQ